MNLSGMSLQKCISGMPLLKLVSYKNRVFTRPLLQHRNKYLNTVVRQLSLKKSFKRPSGVTATRTNTSEQQKNNTLQRVSARMSFLQSSVRTNTFPVHVNTVACNELKGEEDFDTEDEAEEEDVIEQECRSEIEALVAALAQKRKAETSLPSMKTRKQCRYQPPMVEEAHLEPSKETRLDIEGGVKKGTTVKSRTRGPAVPKLSIMVKKTTDSRYVIQKMLDAPIHLSVGEVIGIAPRLHRAFFSGLPPARVLQDEAVPGTEGRLRNIKAAVGTHVVHQTVPKSLLVQRGDKVVYVSTTLRFTIHIGEIALKANIDTGVEINLITEDLADYLGHTIRPG
ncbi:hypothetical protein KEM55_005677, partial [Ascosphaera atra]